MKLKLDQSKLVPAFQKLDVLNTEFGNTQRELHGAVGTAWLRPAWCRLHVFSFEIINKARICMSQFPRYPTSLTIRHHWNINFLVFILCMLSYRYFQWKINKLDQSSLNLIPRDFPFWSLPISVYSGFLMKVSICFIFSPD